MSQQCRCKNYLGSGRSFPRVRAQGVRGRAGEGEGGAMRAPAAAVSGASGTRCTCRVESAGRVGDVSCTRVVSCAAVSVRCDASEPAPLSGCAARGRRVDTLCKCRSLRPRWISECYEKVSTAEEPGRGTSFRVRTRAELGEKSA